MPNREINSACIGGTSFLTWRWKKYKFTYTYNYTKDRKKNIHKSDFNGYI